MNLCACGCGKSARQRFSKGHRLPKPWAFRREERGYDTPCHTWLGSKSPNGYGLFTENGRRTTAHKIAWEREHGPVTDGRHIDHLCRNRDCVNPEHLEPVPCAINIRRGRSSSLTDEIAAAMRVATGPQAQIAARFGVSQATVSRVRSGRTWRTAAR